MEHAETDSFDVASSCAVFLTEVQRQRRKEIVNLYK